MASIQGSTVDVGQISTIVQRLQCKENVATEGIVASSSEAAIVRSSDVGTIAGRLQLFSEAWSKLTNDPIIRKWIRGFEIPFIWKRRQEYIPSDTAWSSSESAEIEK